MLTPAPPRGASSSGKKDEGGDRTSLELVKNPDILATVAKRKGQRLVVGFALETAEGERRARAKMQRKNADHVVLPVNRSSTP